MSYRILFIKKTWSDSVTHSHLIIHPAKPWRIFPNLTNESILQLIDVLHTVASSLEAAISDLFNDTQAELLVRYALIQEKKLHRRQFCFMERPTKPINW